MLQRPVRSLLEVRPALRVLGAVGAALLLLATVLPILRYPSPPGGIADAFDLSVNGWERTAITLPLLAILAAVGLLARGPAARVGGAAIVSVGLVALGTGILVDRPAAAPTLVVGEGGVTSNLEPGSGIGWYLELAGGVLLLAVGAALLLTQRAADDAQHAAGTTGAPGAPGDDASSSA